jgi:multidrug resistance efflux pump
VPGSVPKAKIEELRLKCTETKLAIEKAKHDKAVAEAEAGIAAAEVDAAKTMIELLKVYSPIDGEVVDVRAHKGEAVQPTTPGVVNIVGLNRVWVQGPVPAADFAREQLENQRVTVEVAVTRTRKVSFPGKITAVSPLTDAGGSYTVRAEVLGEKLAPGTPDVVMIIPLKPIESK